MRRLWLSILVAFWMAVPAAAAPRVWTDAEGTTMEAEFIRELDGEVSFLKAGKLITMRLDQLSERDQQVVSDLQAGRPVQEDQPSAAISPRGTDVAPPAPADQRPAAVAEDTSQPKTLRKKANVVSNRVWTDVYGNQMTGKFVRVFDGKVVVSRIGRMSIFRYYDLTSADQEYVKELLISQGQESLIPPIAPVATFLPGQPDNEGPFSPNVGPRPPVEADFPQQPQAVRRGPTELFQELRERDGERRDLQTQALENAEQPREKFRQHHASAMGQEPAASGESADAYSIEHGKESTSASVEQPVVAQAQKWFFLAVVIGGVIGVVTVIVFAAMTIASASSVAKQRQYR
jgi:hypothetical protein